MRTLITLFLAFGVAWSAAQAPGVVLFDRVSVIPMDRERVLVNQMVLVRDGRIAEVGDADRVAVPPGALRVDGRGRFLMPALAEMHAHLHQAPTTEELERRLRTFVANGITTIRNMEGEPGHVALRARVSRGELISPHIYTAGPPFNSNTAPTVDRAIAMAIEQKSAGFDLLKIHPGLDREVFEAVAGTAARLGIRMAGHVPAEVGLQRALDTRFWSIDHLDGYVNALARTSNSGSPAARLVPDLDESRIPDIVARTKAAGTWMVPTQILYENRFGPESVNELANRPEYRYANAAQLQQWSDQKREAMERYTADDRAALIAVRRRLVKALHDGGVPFALGSDAPQVWNVPGFSIHRELGALVAAGLTPYQALATGTRNVAVYFGTLEQGGTIERGKRADLLLLDGNPLQDITNSSRISGIMLGNRWLPKSELERFLAEALP